MLKHVSADHEFFGKSYTFLRPTQQQGINSMRLLNNEDNFFSDLPELKRKGKNIRLLRMTKAERKQQQLDLLEIRKRKMEQRI